jgi:ABC-2 type transport system ATP-binding protein
MMRDHPCAKSHMPDAAAPPAIEVIRLTRRFGAFTAVDALDLTVPAGTIFGLLGPNGAGKTTTIKMLSTLLEPSEGTARVAGFDIVREPREVRRRIGYVPQLVSADGGLTGAENLLLSAKLYGIPRAERRRRVERALAFMGLEGPAAQLVRTYSGGMIRRLEVAQAMLHEPAVLFLDEPTIGLDPVARQAVWARLEEIRRAGATTILITTHDMDEADRLCSALAILHRGRVAAIGAPAALKAEIGPAATLEDVFARASGGGSIDGGGAWRDVRHTRDTARRLG